MQILATPFRKVKGWAETIHDWEFWSDPKWRRSSLLGLAMWLIGTKIIFHFEHWGPGWAVIITVGLAADSLTWALKKLLVWAKRSVDMPVSVGRSWVLWGLFAGVNFALTLSLNTAGDLSTHHTRYAMIPFGIAVNPARYHLDNNVVFGDMSLPELSRLVRDRTQREARDACNRVQGWTRTLSQ